MNTEAVAPEPAFHASDVARGLIDELLATAAPIAAALGGSLAVSQGRRTEWLARGDGCRCPREAELRVGPGSCAPGRRAEPIALTNEGLNVGTCWVCAPADDSGIHAALRRIVEGTLHHLTLAGRESQLLEELGVCWESLEALYEVNGFPPEDQGLETIVERILARLTELDAGTWAAIWVETDGRLKFLGSRGTGMEPLPVHDEPIRRAIAEQRCYVFGSSPESAARGDGASGGWAWGDRTLLAPIESRLGTRGVVAISGPLGGKPFDSRVVRYIQALAMPVVIALEGDRLHRAAVDHQLLQQELEIGSRMQRTLLLGDLQSPVSFARVAHLYLPSQLIGGDFVEYFPHGGRCLDILIGDVMGKGIQGSLVAAAVIRQFYRTLCSLLSAGAGRLPEPEAIVSRVHGEIAHRLAEFDSFVTLDYARLDPVGARFVFVDCGHTPILHYHHRTGRCEPVRGKSMPLGFSDKESYEQIVVSYENRDRFILYSDGVTEVSDERGELYGEDRLISFVEARGASHSPDALTRAVHESLNEFAGGNRFNDDLTIVVVEAYTAVGTDAAHGARSIEVTSELDRLEEIRSFVRSNCLDAPEIDAPPDWFTMLELAVTEAAGNIMIHAYDGQAGRPIRGECEVSGERVLVRLIHEGVPFDPSSVEEPTFDGKREGGFGVYLIGQCVDEATYTHYGSGRSAITLIVRQTSRAGA